MSFVSRTRSREGAQRIREFILASAADGTLAPGNRLPTERELARASACRATRCAAALAQLEAEGSITRHVGRGTFLAGRAAAPAATSAQAASPTPAPRS